MADSVSKTNIPVLRTPFGSETPPKVPVCETTDVGSNVNPVYVKDKKIVASDASVGDVQQPVYMKNGVLTAGDILAPVLAPSFKRDPEGGTMTMDVPTSPTPQEDDPGTMIATKQYVDDHIGSGGGSVPLLTHLWFDRRLINNHSWLESDCEDDLTTTNMHTKANYKFAYNHLYGEYTTATEKSQTFTLTSGTTVTVAYREAADGHKICDLTQITNLNTIFNDDKIGEAWFFVLDTENEKFHLPRTKYGFHGNLSYVKRPQAGDQSMFLFFYVGEIDETEGTFISSDLEILKETEYKFPVIWTAGQYADYTVENNCTLFYHIQMKQNGQIVQNGKLFTLSVVLNGTTEIPIDGVNPITNGSDVCIGSFVCKSGTVLRLKNASSGSLPISTDDEPLFYILRETGPLQTSETFDGRLSADVSVLRTVDYTFTENWTGNAYKDYTIENDCLLTYKFQIKSDGQICNQNRQFLMCAIVNGEEIPIDGVNEVSNGDDVRMGTILCKAGTVIRMKNASTIEFTASSDSYYTLKEIA